MKVVCDVCGTTFPETASNCPICGCAKAPTAQLVDEDTDTAPETTSANSYARGGRFSTSNVKRNNRSRGSESKPKSKESNGGNKGLIAVVIILLVAVIAVAGYIGFRLLSTDFGGNNNNQQVGDPNPDEKIPCTDIQLSAAYKELISENEQFLLSVELVPADTTDTVTFVSSNPEIAHVNADGLVTPGTKQGEATITVTCGQIVKECKIVSKVGESQVTEPTTPPGPVLPDGFVLKLKTYKDSGEITIAGDGVAYLYSETMGVKASDITWTSSDPAIATVENGKVTGVGKGYCYITATIGDQTATCKVICTSDGTPPSDYAISHVDVTISVGETFNLSLKHKETGANVQGIAWQVSEEGFVSINGNKITGQSVNWSGVQVYVEYEGIRYTCRIIVKPAA